MNALTLNLPKKHFTFIVQNLVSFVFVIFLAYIDEGYYSFKWMLEPRAWLAVLIYVGIFSIGQMIAKVYFFKEEYDLGKSIGIGFVGIGINLALIIALVFLGKALF